MVKGMLNRFLELKHGVDSSGVHPHLWFHLGVVAYKHHEVTNKKLVVTSLRREFNPLAIRPSKHRPRHNELATAADLRRWYLDEDQTEGDALDFCLWIRHTMGDELGIVLEPEWADYGGAPHIHLQSKPTKLFYRLSQAGLYMPI
jgi:hypothetical protein